MNANAAVTNLLTKNILKEVIELEWQIDFTNILFTRTPVFAPAKNIDTKFYFELWYQRSHDFNNPPTVGLQVILRKLPESSVLLDLEFEFSVSIQYSDDSNFSNNKYYESDTYNLAEFTERICILASDRKCIQRSTNSDYNKPILKCQMIFYGHMLSPTSYRNEINSLRGMRELTKNFEALYLSNELSDVSIQVGEKVFKTHKFVLAANSPVFKRMLMLDFLEVKTGIITISDIEPKLFESFLKFLYTGELEDKSFSNFKKLYFLADRYDVQILKEGCFKVLTDCNLNEDQIDDVLEMAYKYNDDSLKKAAKQLLLTVIKK